MDECASALHERIQFRQLYYLPISKAQNQVERCPGRVRRAAPDSGAFHGLSGDYAREAIIKHCESHGLGAGGGELSPAILGVSQAALLGCAYPYRALRGLWCAARKLENLPTTPPEDVSITGEGNPLEKHPTFTKALCPKCEASQTRERYYGYIYGI